MSQDGEDAARSYAELEEELENRTVELQMAAEFGQRLLEEDNQKRATIEKMQMRIQEMKQRSEHQQKIAREARKKLDSERHERLKLEMDYEERISSLSQLVTTLRVEASEDATGTRPKRRLHYRSTSGGGKHQSSEEAVSPSSESGGMKAAIQRLISHNSAAGDADASSRHNSMRDIFEDNEEANHLRRQLEDAKRQLLKAEMEKSTLEDEADTLRHQLEDNEEAADILKDQLEEFKEEVKSLRLVAKQASEEAETLKQSQQEWRKAYSGEDAKKEDENKEWFSSLSVKQAKKLCSANNIDTTRCVEKNDLLNLLKAAPQSVKRDAENRGYVTATTRDVGVLCQLLAPSEPAEDEASKREETLSPPKVDYGPPKPIEGHLLLLKAKKGRVKASPYYFLLRGPSITYFKDQWSLKTVLGSIRLDGIEIRIIHDARHTAVGLPQVEQSADEKKKKKRKSLRLFGFNKSRSIDMGEFSGTTNKDRHYEFHVCHPTRGIKMLCAPNEEELIRWTHELQRHCTSSSAQPRRYVGGWVWTTVGATMFAEKVLSPRSRRKSSRAADVGRASSTPVKSGSVFFGKSLSNKTLDALIGHAPTFGGAAPSSSPASSAVDSNDGDSEASSFVSASPASTAHTSKVKWMRCFIVLKGSLIYFYRSSSDMMHYYALDLSSVDIEAEYQRNIFLSSDGTTHQMRGENSRDRDWWVRALTACKAGIVSWGEIGIGELREGTFGCRDF